MQKRSKLMTSGSWTGGMAEIGVTQDSPPAYLPEKTQSRGSRGAYKCPSWLAHLSVTLAVGVFSLTIMELSFH